MPSSVLISDGRAAEIDKACRHAASVMGVEKIIAILERVLAKSDLQALDRAAYEQVLADLRDRAGEWRAK